MVAFGVDKNLQLARDIAKSELAKQIKIDISSSTHINKSIENGNYNKSIKKNISTSTNTTLQGIKILKESKQDNLWYVSVIYDNRTLLQKIKANKLLIRKSKINNNYLYSTSLVKDIFKTLGFKTKINLITKNNSWYLNISDNLFLLNKEDFKKLFKNYTNKNVNFYSNKNIYKYPDNMQFKINTKKKGYVSILYSESNGKIGVILDNIKIYKHIAYPKDTDENKLTAYNPSKDTVTEMYIAIYSKNKIDLKEFEQVSDNILDESNYNFNKLLTLLDSNQYSLLTLKIKGK